MEHRSAFYNEHKSVSSSRASSCRNMSYPTGTKSSVDFSRRTLLYSTGSEALYHFDTYAHYLSVFAKNVNLLETIGYNANIDLLIASLCWTWVELDGKNRHEHE